jgi:flagellin
MSRQGSCDALDTEVFNMRINHNISSMIGQGSLATQNKSLSKSLEKLSTGLRINRASDDAAGLSVSESLRSKIRGMGRAKMNAEDGIALIQIAEARRRKSTTSCSACANWPSKARPTP